MRHKCQTFLEALIFALVAKFFHHFPLPANSNGATKVKCEVVFGKAISHKCISLCTWWWTIKQVLPDPPT
ncbi:hypothetical protein O6H91_03G007200 [Diphasiastrum complanatum]|uniref:Uncharacterized protein n=1 Tax=Diphasiastrum complanatum TaxID=34168 RepID=A0ACC2E3C8_DIPCM|nr:hypothetical protein O6H91_03G007200 [Diphasiastrum complanatum]